MVHGQEQQVAILLENAAAIRGGRLVLEKFTLRANSGDIIWLRGPNGSGKSTLLRLIAGLLPMAGGQRDVMGSMALVDDSSPLDNDLPLEKALNFWAEQDNAPASHRQSALAAFELSGMSEIPISYLSSGQIKRAELARMINSDAQIWLLDEPYNGLDSRNGQTLDKLLVQHAAKGGIAIVAAHKSPEIDVAQSINLGAQNAEAAA